MAKKKIVYLLGAGASANALPTYNNMVSRMKIFIDIIRDFHLKRMMGKSETEVMSIADQYEILKEYNDFINLISEVGTPDAIARTCYYSEVSESQGQLEFLKNFLCAFFEFEMKKNFEFVNKCYHNRETSDFPTGEIYSRTILDPRYEKFISTFSEKSADGLKIADNVSIISWNYDMQLEMTFKKKFTTDALFQVQKRLNIFPKLVSDERQKQIPYKTNGFSLLKLNGTAHFYYNDEKIFEGKNSKNTTEEESELGDLFNILYSYGDGKTPRYPHLLHFAWEKENENIRNAREYAQEKIDSADAIVIIGYSFPDFNREIDKEIFKNLRDGVKVYIQDSNYEGVRKKLIGVNSKTSHVTEHQNVTSNFYIPQEFWEDIDNSGWWLPEYS